MSDELDKETVALEKMVNEAAEKISEHTDSVVIIITKKAEDGSGCTYRFSRHCGNYYASYGAAREWLLKMDSQRLRSQEEEEE